MKMERIQFESGTHRAVYNYETKKWFVMRGSINIGSIDADGECMYFDAKWSGHGYGDFDDYYKIMKQIAKQCADRSISTSLKQSI